MFTTFQKYEIRITLFRLGTNLESVNIKVRIL
nr:MAG TPA: hypothetical protein [Caudoviricetes sp.]